MSRMPGAAWKPLPRGFTTPMTGHDIICEHTMVGSLAGTDGYFRGLTNGVNSHYGTGGLGEIWQWGDTRFRSGANLNGNPNVISIENADMGPGFPAWNTRDGNAVPAFTPAQIEANARILAWESSRQAHAACPPNWSCHKHGIPLELIPDAKPGRRGIGYHRQGVPGYMAPGAVKWSSATGKVCPGDRRIAQIPQIIARARQIVAAESGHPIIGDIRRAYDRPILPPATWAFFLGAPKGAEVPTLDKVGRWQEFAKGAIYWHPANPPAKDGSRAYVLWGDILKRWRQLGSETWRGYPVTDETSCPDGQGRYNHFTDNASIYWHPATGAHPVLGGFRGFWARQGWETGPLGYPTSAEYRNAAGQTQQNFQGGALRLTTEVEAVPL